MTAVVVEQPGDSVVVGISEPVEPVEPVDYDIIVRGWEIEEYGKVLRFVCLFDAIMVGIQFLVTEYLPLLVSVILNIYGYYGTKLYKKSYMYLYSGFQFFTFVLKIVYIFFHYNHTHVAIAFGISSFFNLILGVFSYNFSTMIPT